MKKNIVLHKIVSLFIVSMMVLSLAACGSGSASDSSGASSNPGGGDSNEKAIHIKLPLNVSTNNLNNSASGLSLLQFKENVEARSEGKLIVDLFPDNQLASTTEEYVGGLQNGSFEMINLAHASWGNYTDAFACLNTPYLFKTEDVVYGLLNNSSFSDTIKQQVEESTGAYILSYIPVGYRHITNNKHAIHTPDDVKGLKLRVQEDKLQIAGMEALGCAVTPCSFSELFTAMQQGLVDGQENPITNIYFSKFYEVQKYMTLSGHSYGVSVFVINKKYFESLPEEYQIILQEEAKNSEEFARAKLAEMEGEMLAEIEKQGMEITRLTDSEQAAFIEAVRPAWGKVEEVMGTEAYQEMLGEVERLEGELGLA